MNYIAHSVYIAYVKACIKVPVPMPSYETYNGADEKLSPLVRQISWSNNLAIMSRCKTYQERAFNLNLCVHDRLSYRQFECQIDSALYERNTVGSPKLSAVLREIAPQAETKRCCTSVQLNFPEY